MSTVNIDLSSDTQLNMILGQQDETEVREVVFDFSGWYTTYGSGTISLSVQRSKDEWPYEVELTVDNTNHTATWTITDTDTGYAGVGMVQITYTVGTAKKKSVVYRFTVYKSLGATGNVITPVQLQTWMDEVDQEIADIKQDLAELRNGVPTDVRKAIYALLNKDAYAQIGLSGYINTVKLWAAEATSVTLNQSSISISGTGTYQLIATTEPSGVAVTWASSDISVATVDGNGLVTSVGNGTATITASVGELTATCEVTISGFATLTSIEAVYTPSGVVFNTDTLDSLKSDLVVTAYYDDNTSTIITNYMLSGSLTGGTNTIIVTYGGKTDTFDVSVLYALPSGYTGYDYIKNGTIGNNGYKSAVFTGLDDTYGSDNYEHSIEFAYDSGTSTTGGGFFGLRKEAGTTANSITIWQKYISSNTGGYAFEMKGNTYGSFINSAFGSKNKCVVTYSEGNINVYLNDEKIIDGESGTFEVGEGGEFTLFKAQTGTSKSATAGQISQYARIYKYTVKNLITGNYVAYMIPCKNASAEAGFFDCVRNDFYTAYSGASNLSALND